MNESKPKNNYQIAFYRVMMYGMNLLMIGAVIIIVVFLLPLIPPFYPRNALTLKLVNTALSLQKPILSFVRGSISATRLGLDITGWGIIGTACLMAMSLSWLKDLSHTRLSRLRLRKEYEVLKENMNLSDNSKVLEPVKRQIENYQMSKKKDREELLRLFADAKKKIESMGRTLAFLSIDVVGSTAMKNGEDKVSIELDFGEYKRFVNAKIQAHDVMKSTWTPDGVMCCFPTVDSAVRAARDIISELEYFNKNVKTLKQDFSVRCGINSGRVYYDESVPMEEMSDHVIDVAGHMQKYASPNTICIAKPSIEPLEDRDGFSSASKVVDGYEVYEWKSV